MGTYDRDAKGLFDMDDMNSGSPSAPQPLLPLLDNQPRHGGSVLFRQLASFATLTPPMLPDQDSSTSPLRSPQFALGSFDQSGSPQLHLDSSIVEGIYPALNFHPNQYDPLADIQNNDVGGSPNSVYFTPLQSPLMNQGSPLAIASSTLNPKAPGTPKFKRRKLEQRYTCPIPGCGSSFTSTVNLTNHMRHHRGVRPFLCHQPGCGKEFTQKEDCRRHEREDHSLVADLRALECQACGMQFTQIVAFNHHLQHEGNTCLRIYDANTIKGENYFVPGYSVRSLAMGTRGYANGKDEQTRLRGNARSLILEIAENQELRNQFISVFSADENKSAAQVIANCVNAILYEETFANPDDHAKILRLLCKFLGAAQIYPDRFMLANIEMALLPFQGGGFADTFEGKYNGKAVCVKVIRVFSQEPQAKLLKEVARETTLWAHTSHENILPFYGVYKSDMGTGRICLVSPLMKNGDLEEYLRANPTAYRIPLVIDVINGLHYLHQLKIVHGDLKARNVLISDNGRGLITDFGLSYIAMTAVVGSTEVTPACTLNWTAPELACAAISLKPTKASDVWSFGCLCYEVFTGKYPYYECTMPQVVVALVQRRPPIRPLQDQLVCNELDDRIWGIMKTGCWKPEPTDRHSSEMLRDALTGIRVRGGFHGNPLNDQKTAFWEAMRDQAKFKIDYNAMNDILSEFLDKSQVAEMS